MATYQSPFISGLFRHAAKSSKILSNSLSSSQRTMTISPRFWLVLIFHGGRSLASNAHRRTIPGFCSVVIRGPRKRGESGKFKARSINNSRSRPRGCPFVGSRRGMEPLTRGLWHFGILERRLRRYLNGCLFKNKLDCITEVLFASPNSYVECFVNLNQVSLFDEAKQFNSA